tara:strand:- start:985 stop:1194 length:210 start_codon:yes stop_codon:yes gene_type:complete
MSKYETDREVIEAFHSSTFRNPKLTYGGALEILMEEFGFEEPAATLALFPEMPGAEVLEIWKVPGGEEE